MNCCGASPPEELLLALRQFNRGEWFACHETLEELWVGTQGELRDFYQGLLQLAVALHHWEEGNLKGALFLLESGGGMLRRVPAVCQGVDAAGLAAAAAKLQQALLARGEDLMAGIPAELMPKARLVPVPGHPDGEGQGGGTRLPKIKNRQKKTRRQRLPPRFCICLRLLSQLP